MAQVDYYSEKNTSKVSYTPTKRTTGGGGVNKKITVDKNGTAKKKQKLDMNVTDSTEKNPDKYTSNKRTTPIEKKEEPQKRSAYSSVSYSGRKMNKYYQLGSNLSNLVQNKYSEIAKKQENSNFLQGLVSTISTALSWIPGVGQVAVGAGNAVNSWIQYGSTKKQNKLAREAQNLEQMAQNLTNYVGSLTNRDEIVENSVLGMYSAIDEMSTTYGSEFVDQIFNVYMAASGVTPESYSLLNGNFNVFGEDLGMGNVSADNGIFDQLTNVDSNYFENVYAQITTNDLNGIHDRLVQSLYGANTAFSEQLRGYEVELRNLLTGALADEKQTVANATGQLAQLQAGYRAESIGYAENIGSAEAGSAVSGMRGGTSYNNVALEQLSRDIGLIKRTAELTAFMGNVSYQIDNMHRQLSMSAYNLRENQIVAQKRAEESAVIGFNSIGRNLQSGERKANYYLGEGQQYERQFNEGYEKVSATDADAIFRAL